MTSVVIQALLVALACSLLQVQAQQTIPTQNGNCSTAPNDTQVAYEGWFHKIDCNVGSFVDHLLEDENVNENVMWGSPDYFPADDEVYQCMISNWRTGEILLNKTVDDSKLSELFIEVYDVQTSNNGNVFKVEIAMLKLKKCQTQFVKLNVTTMEKESCLKSSESVLSFRLVQGSTQFLLCRGKDIKIPFPALLPLNETNYKIEWLYNCSRNLPAGVDMRDGKLYFLSSSLKHSGLYTCSVSHNDRKRYLHTRICLTKQRATSFPKITCKQSTYYVKMSHNVTFDCVVDVGYGTIAASSFLSVWIKDQFECFPDLGVTTQQDQSSSYFCCNVLRKNDVFCGANASEELPKATANVQLSLTNVQSKDLGNYTVMVRYLRHATSIHVLLVEDAIDGTRNQVLVFGLILGLVGVGVVAGSGFFFYFRCKNG